MSKEKKQAPRQYTAEYKAEAVKLDAVHTNLLDKQGKI
jgi:hypothetical protein